jgi:antirestriction protein ArdC
MESHHPSWAALLERAVMEPGIISSAYFAFHEYSLGNCILAWSQAEERKIALGPIATYAKWQALRRQVRRGEKAIWLCQPVTIKRKIDGTDQDEEIITRFAYKPHWFFLAQTDGAEIPSAAIPGWDRTRALSNLDVTEEPFASLDGNCQGYAHHRTIAVSLVAAHPLKTFAHEVAHVILGHTTEQEQTDSELTPRTLREVEAEATAMLVCAALGLPGVELSRGYIQHWNASGEAIPERSCQRIFKAADQILKAGTTTPADTAAVA